MTEIGDVVAYFVEEELLGGGVALHPRPSIVVDLDTTGQIASMWTFGPQQMDYMPNVYWTEGPSRNHWMSMEEWRKR